MYQRWPAGGRDGPQTGDMWVIIGVLEQLAGDSMAKHMAGVATYLCCNYNIYSYNGKWLPLWQAKSLDYPGCLLGKSTLIKPDHTYTAGSTWTPIYICKMIIRYQLLSSINGSQPYAIVQLFWICWLHRYFRFCLCILKWFIFLYATWISLCTISYLWELVSMHIVSI